MYSPDSAKEITMKSKKINCRERGFKVTAKTLRDQNLTIKTSFSAVVYKLTNISFFVSLLLMLTLLSAGAGGFDLPVSDPWYYQSDDRGLAFMVPDKAQHYWGSRLLAAALDRLPLPARTVTSPLLALAAGLGYELWQESKGIGFSPRDLLANALGIAGQRAGTLTTWVDYSTVEKTITFNVSVGF